MSTVTKKTKTKSSENFVIPEGITPKMLGVKSLKQIRTDRAYQIKITHDLSKKLLQNNVFNRSHSKSNLRFIEGQMNGDRMKLNGETIKITKEGHIMDGQHRLMASVNTKKSFDAFIIFGLDKKAFTTLDTGKMRTAADIISVERHKDHELLAATAKMVLSIKTGTRGLVAGGLKGTKFDNQDVLDFVETTDRFIDRVYEAKKIWKQIRNPRFVPAKIFAAMYFLFSELNIIETEKFMKAFAFGYGEYISENSPALILRNTFIKWKSDNKRIRRNSFDKCVVIAKAWNAHRTNKEIKRLNFKNGEEMPKLR